MVKKVQYLPPFLPECGGFGGGNALGNALHGDRPLSLSGKKMRAAHPCTARLCWREKTDAPNGTSAIAEV